MKENVKRFTTVVLVCFSLLYILAKPAAACCDPPCGTCEHCSGGLCVDDADGTDCGNCKECSGGSCQSTCSNTCCNDVCCEAGQICCDGTCCDPDDCCNGCESCNNGSCVDDDNKCDSLLCQECDDGVCEDRCPPLGLHCYFGDCVECIDILDCELCEECENHECVHPCDECYYPNYCAYACTCVECYPGPVDTTTCSSENSTTECDCSQNILNPCGGVEESVVYSGSSLTSCTGPDCSSDDVLCYTTYQTCKTSSAVKPLLWCVADDTGPPPPAPWPKSCKLNTDIPGPGCWDCVNTYESGDPTYEPKGVCPTEAWP